MSLKAFQDALRKQIIEFCKERDLNDSDSKSRGMAFEVFCFDLLTKRFDISEATEQECIFTQNDAGIDIVIPDLGNETYYIAQCKLSVLNKKRPINEDAVTTFFSRFRHIMDKNWVAKKAGNNTDLVRVLRHFRKDFHDGWTVKYMFLTTETDSDASEATLRAFRGEYLKNHNLDISILDVNDLARMRGEAESFDVDIPKHVEAKLKVGNYIVENDPVTSITAIVPANILVEWYRMHKESLFSENIRSFLRFRGAVNKGIKETIAEEPENFYLYNNGVSAVCFKLDFDPETRKLSAESFRIINGAQTVGSLSHAGDEAALDKVNVLLRVTETKKFSSELSANIIRFNNTQNSVRASDFRSNDPIQLWLESKFDSTKKKGILPKITYARKRPYRSKQGTQLLTLEEFAKIRYSYLRDPLQANVKPSELWTLQGDGGKYEIAFGEGGNLSNFLPDSEFEEFLYFYMFWRKINEKLDVLSKELGFKGFKRFRFFALNLAKHFTELSKEVLESNPDIKAGSAQFEKFFDEYWKCAGAVLKRHYEKRVSQGDETQHAVVRNARAFYEISQDFKIDYKSYIESGLARALGSD